MYMYMYIDGDDLLSRFFKVISKEFIKYFHMSFFSEQNMVSKILKYFRNESECSSNSSRDVSLNQVVALWWY